MATSFPLVIASVVFTFLAFIAIIIAIGTTSWYVVQTEHTTVHYGSIKICDELRDGNNTQVCRGIASEEFSVIGDNNPQAPICEHTTAEMSLRFASLFGISIIAILLCAGCVGLLVFATVIAVRKFLEARAEARRRAEQMDNPPPTPSGSDSEESDDDIIESSQMPLPEFVAMLIMPAIVLITLIVWVVYLGNVKTWLYCNSDPCDFLGQNDDITVCEASLGYSFAFAVFAWLSVTISMVLLILRYVMLKVFGEDIPEEEEEQEGDDTTTAVLPANLDGDDTSPREQQSDNQHANLDDTTLNQTTNGQIVIFSPKEEDAKEDHGGDEEDASSKDSHNHDDTNNDMGGGGSQGVTNSLSFQGGQNGEAGDAEATTTSGGGGDDAIPNEDKAGKAVRNPNFLDVTGRDGDYNNNLDIISRGGDEDDNDDSNSNGAPPPVDEEVAAGGGGRAFFDPMMPHQVPEESGAEEGVVPRVGKKKKDKKDKEKKEKSDKKDKDKKDKDKKDKDKKSKKKPKEEGYAYSLKR